MLPSLHKLFSQTGGGTRKRLSLCRCPTAGQISVPKPLLHRNPGAYSGGCACPVAFTVHKRCGPAADRRRRLTVVRLTCNVGHAAGAPPREGDTNKVCKSFGSCRGAHRCCLLSCAASESTQFVSLQTKFHMNCRGAFILEYCQRLR